MRRNLKGELFAHITDVGVFRDTAGGGSSTIASTLPAIGTYNVHNVASGTNFAIGDFYRLRALDNYPEISQVDSIAVNAITPRYPLHRAVVVGDPAVEQTQVSFGHLAQDGVKYNLAVTSEDVHAANRRLWLAQLMSYAKITVEFSVLGFNLENVMSALGMLDTNANILGAGSQADPNRAFIDGTKLKEQNDLCWYVNGTRKDGRVLLMQAWGCELDYTAVEQALARGKAAMIPIRLTPTHAVSFAEID
jgi:hypothetical protein